jgi:hypothetical protein
MNSCALASLAAPSTSSSLAAGRPIAMFSAMVVANSVGSWLTSPTWPRSQPRRSRRMSTPSSSTQPAAGS